MLLHCYNLPDTSLVRNPSRRLGIYYTDNERLCTVGFTPSFLRNDLEPIMFLAPECALESPRFCGREIDVTS